MKKSEKIILGVLAVVGAGAVYEFVLSGDSSGNTSSQRMIEHASEVAPAPRAATLQEYSDMTEEAAPEYTERETRLEELEYSARVSVLEAQIAENEKRKNAAEIDIEKAEAEVERIRAEIQREDRRAEFEREREERVQRRLEEESLRDAQLAQRDSDSSRRERSEPAPMSNPQPMNFTQVAAGPQPENETQLLRVRGNRATVSVQGQIAELAVGYPFNGIRLISVDEENGGATVEGRVSGKKVDLMVSYRSSRQFSRVRALNPEARDTEEVDEEELRR